MLIDLYVVLAVATKVRAVGLGLATPEAITNNWRPIAYIFTAMQLQTYYMSTLILQDGINH